MCVSEQTTHAQTTRDQLHTCYRVQPEAKSAEAATHLAKLELGVAGGEKVDGVDAEASIDENQGHCCTHAGYCNCIGQCQHDLPNLHAQDAVRAHWSQT